MLACSTTYYMPFGNLKCCHTRRVLSHADAAAASQFFYKEAYLDYGQLVTDGFYHVRKQFSRLPTLGELEANPQLAGGQVVMVVDRARDAPLVTLEVQHVEHHVPGLHGHYGLHGCKGALHVVMAATASMMPALLA